MFKDIKLYKANNPSDVRIQPDLSNNRSDPYFLPDGHNLEAGTNRSLFEPCALRCGRLNNNLIQCCLSYKPRGKFDFVYFWLYFYNFYCWLYNY